MPRKDKSKRTSFKEWRKKSDEDFNKHPVKTLALGCLVPLALVVGFFVFIANLPESESKSDLAELEEQKAKEDLASTDGMGDTPTKEPTPVKAETKPKKKKADPKKLSEAQSDQLNNIMTAWDGDIKAIEPAFENWSTTRVVFSDAWYNTPEHEQERILQDVGLAVHAAIGDKVKLVRFSDTYGKDIGKETVMGSYKIIK